MKKLALLLALGVLLAWAASAMAAPAGLETLAGQAVALARERLGPLDDPAAVACLTNAGYAQYQGSDTLALQDHLARLAPISPGRGNLLVRPCPPGQPLYFMFLKKKAKQKLLMTYVRATSDGPRASQAMDIHLAVGTSFEPFKKVLGPMAFNLVSLANGWAMGLPPDLRRAALKHGHLCCGVFTGYFTARYILKHMPLKPGQRYIYIGAPAWCQDDYLIDYLGLTPGTHGYFTMSYPWSRPWRTRERVHANLGGVVIVWDPRVKSGRAWVLAFDWRHEAFRQYLGKPGLKLDWRGQPWLHNAYDRFFLSKLGQTEFFVSTIKSAPLKGQAQLDRLTLLGANPLAVLLGPDHSWPPSQSDKP